jgi:septum formation protein
VSSLVLASGSPRRREILDTLGLSFDVCPSAADEVALPGEAPGPMARRLARDKAVEVAGRGETEVSAYVLGADTVVVVDGEVLGKPKDDAEAREMLSRLGGRWHEVVTGVALARAGQGAIEDLAVTTRVHFRLLSADRVDRYAATGEGRDKAGAYAVQGIGSGLVDRIEGSYTNVVGLPAAETVDLLERHGALREWP